MLDGFFSSLGAELWIIPCLFIGFWAKRDDRSAGNWILLSFIVTPIISAAILTFLQKQADRGRALDQT